MSATKAWKQSGKISQKQTRRFQSAESKDYRRGISQGGPWSALSGNWSCADCQEAICCQEKSSNQLEACKLVSWAGWESLEGSRTIQNIRWLCKHHYDAARTSWQTIELSDTWQQHRKAEKEIKIGQNR